MARPNRDAQGADAAPFDADIDAVIDDVVSDIVGVLDESPPDPAPSRRARPSRKSKRTEDDDETLPPDDDPDADIEEEAADDDPEDDDLDPDEESDQDDDESEDDDEDDDESEDDASDYAELKRQHEAVLAERERDRLAAERAEAERTAHDRARAYEVREREGRVWFDTKEAQLDELEERIVADAERSVNPRQYLINGLRRVRTDRKALAAERDQWFRDFETGKTAPRNEQMLDLAIRAMVAEAQVEHGLSHAEAAQLRAFAKKYPDPELVGAEFDRILDNRELNQKLATSSARRVRKRAARDLAANTPRPGQGRRASSRPARTVDEEIDRVLAAAPW